MPPRSPALSRSLPPIPRGTCRRRPQSCGCPRSLRFPPARRCQMFQLTHCLANSSSLRQRTARDLHRQRFERCSIGPIEYCPSGPLPLIRSPQRRRTQAHRRDHRHFPDRCASTPRNCPRHSSHGRRIPRDSRRWKSSASCKTTLPPWSHWTRCILSPLKELRRRQHRRPPLGKCPVRSSRWCSNHQASSCRRCVHRSESSRFPSRTSRQFQ